MRAPGCCVTVAACMIAGTACLCGCGGNEPASTPRREQPAAQKPAQSPPQKPPTPQPSEAEAKIAALEATIRQNADSPDVGEQIVKLEQMIIEQIRQEGPHDRFVIKEISPREGAARGSLCLVSHPQGGAMAQTDLPGDKILVDLPFVGIVAQGEGTRWVPNIFRPAENGIEPAEDIPGGDGSIHRYEGAVPLGVGVDYVFVGEKEKAQRLTFVLIKGVGYVYLRGRGVVMTTTGKTIPLGQ